MKPSNHASNFVLKGGNIPKVVSQIIDTLVGARRRGFQVDITHGDNSIDYIVRHPAAPIEWHYKMPDKDGFDYKLPAHNFPVAVSQVVNCLIASRRHGFKVTLIRESQMFRYSITHSNSALQWQCVLPDIDGFKDKVVLH